ncbi:MAG TPA: hypothetical protein VMA74_11190 [Dyella sp.]|uniref:hypothetical protein n=1 Tax=Dyella sp. TaxID=1869338 RepID=UPI002CCAE506|nr:hypothetical protein [Dyella sp.]HUB90276.1 hypothetical protein [Dyella sp.]
MSRFNRCLRRTGLTLGLGLATSSACAQWAVIDQANLAANQEGFYNQLQQTIQQLLTEKAQLEQLMSKISGLHFGINLGNQSLQPVSDASRDQLIQMNCQGESGGIIGSAVNALTSLASQSIRQSQQQICAQIVIAQVDKYNITVTMLNEVQKYNTVFDQVSDIIDEVDTLADAGRAHTQAQTYSNALTTEMANWRAQMEADDAIIRTLEDQQSMLARAALNGGGGGSVAGSALNAVFGNL